MDTGEQIAVVILLISLVTIFGNKKLRGLVVNQFRSADGRYIKTITLIAVGIMVLNVICWNMIPWLWGVLYHTWFTFVIFNIGFGAMLFLRTIKAKDDNGNSTKEIDPTSSKLAFLITLMLVLGLSTIAVLNWQRGDLTPAEWERKEASEKAIRAAFRAISNPDTRAVLSAIYACNQEDPLFKISEKGELPAIREYRNHGVAPWRGETERCWLSKLQGLTFVLAVVEAKPDEWSKPVFQPEMLKYDLDSECPPDQEFERRLNGDDQFIFSKGDVNDKVPAYSLEYRGVGGPARMTLVMKPRQTKRAPRTAGRSSFFIHIYFSLRRPEE